MKIHLPWEKNDYEQHINVKFWSDEQEVNLFSSKGQGFRITGKITLRKVNFGRPSWGHIEECPYQSTICLENSSWAQQRKKKRKSSVFWLDLVGRNPGFKRSWYHRELRRRAASRGCSFPRRGEHLHFAKTQQQNKHPPNYPLMIFSFEFYLSTLLFIVISEGSGK